MPHTMLPCGGRGTAAYLQNGHDDAYVEVAFEDEHVVVDASVRVQLVSILGADLSVTVRDQATAHISPYRSRP